MSRYRICVLAPANTGAYNERIRAAIKPVCPPDVEITLRNLTQGHDCIENRCNLTENAPHVVELARSLEAEGFHGIFVSDFDMCGVEPAREAVDIPVIGGFDPCAFTALALSESFSIVTVLASVVGLQKEHVSTYGLNTSFASIRAIDCTVQELSNLDLVVSRVSEQALLAVQKDGAQSILLGCTGFIGVAERVQVLLEEALGTYVPVIDPNQASFGFLVSLVRMGLRPSRVCYAKA